MSYSFHHKRSSDSLFNTEAVDPGGCTLPGCRIVIAAEGVVAGQVTDINGLSLVLPPGHRFYVATDPDIGRNFHTIEVYYQQR